MRDDVFDGFQAFSPFGRPGHGTDWRRKYEEERRQRESFERRNTRLGETNLELRSEVDQLKGRIAGLQVGYGLMADRLMSETARLNTEVKAHGKTRHEVEDLKSEATEQEARIIDLLALLEGERAQRRTAEIACDTAEGRVNNLERYLETERRSMDAVDAALPVWQFTGRGRVETINTLVAKVAATEGTAVCGDDPCPLTSGPTEEYREVRERARTDHLDYIRQLIEREADVDIILNVVETHARSFNREYGAGAGVVIS